jgi:Polyketide cyclase / dehydrase and lipid transport
MGWDLVRDAASQQTLPVVPLLVRVDSPLLLSAGEGKEVVRAGYASSVVTQGSSWRGGPVPAPRCPARLQMIEVVARSLIARAVGDVFAFVANLDNIPHWVHGAHVQQVSPGPFGEGTLFQEGNVVVQVSHFQVNAGFETESVAIGFPTRLVLRHTHGLLLFEPTGQGTRFTLAHQFELTHLAKPLQALITQRAQRDSQAAVEQVRNVLQTR